MTPESLPRHELAGLDVSVEASPNPDLVGVAGRVVDETTGTLLVATDDGVKQLPKASTTFRFSLDRGTLPASVEAGGDDPRADEDVLVDGERLVARPARRTETTGGSVWR